MRKLVEIQNWVMSNNRPKVFLQTFLIGALMLVMFNAGRTMEQDNYVKTLDRPYPLHPQPYFGGLSIKHLALTW